MHFGEKQLGGIPLYLNGEIAGWVCTTINGQFNHVLARHNIKSDTTFNTEHQAKLNLISIFGE
jgi:hypothetical protein